MSPCWTGQGHRATQEIVLKRHKQDKGERRQGTSTQPVQHSAITRRGTELELHAVESGRATAAGGCAVNGSAYDMSGCMIRHGSASYSMGMGRPRVQDPQVQLPALCTLVLVRPAQQGTCAACTRCRTRHTLHQKL